MSCPHVVWALRQRGLTAIERVVLIYLADRANGITRVCWPSVQRIAADCELSVRGVQGVLRRLCQRGLIAIRSVVGRVSTYLILRAADDNPAWPPPLDADPPSKAEPPHGVPGSPPEPPHDMRAPPAPHAGVEPMTPAAHAGGTPARRADESPKRESPKKEERSSVLRTGAPAAPVAVEDIRKRLYSEGKEILRRQVGMLNGKAGGMITDLLKRGDGDCAVVLASLHAAEEEGVPPDGFIGWVTEAIRHRKTHRFRDGASEILHHLGIRGGMKGLRTDFSAFNEEAAHA